MAGQYAVYCAECGDLLRITRRISDSDGDIQIDVEPCGKCLEEAQETKDNEIARWQEIAAAYKSLVRHYEEDSERSHYDTADLPEELQALERARDAAEEEKKDES